MTARATAPLSTVLVDDEAPALDELIFLLKEFPEIEIAGTARNGPEAVRLIEELGPDLAFLDVQMPGLDGLGVINQLKADRAPLPCFVLCTAYEQYALEAFRLEALDYLVKPVERERLALTVERARRALAEPEAPPAPAAEAAPPPRTKLLVRSGGRNLIADASDLVYATIQDGLITVVTAQFEGQSNYKTIEELQSNLDPRVFWRVHRSYLVNINRIREVIPWFKSSYQLRMDDRNQSEIPVSRVQTRRLRELLKL
jgi:two-component system LytT family response regulator/two-component system response regulator LytT